ncbi:FliO/MopB family protein [Terasakiella pusilla]|jgi:flagellar protein FliO/FliZ|uniref:FliO/MopB family protein n=1 Tax=Terasakiella pusilla TaxID=64973 RepID=UPI00068BA49E|nr:flagellar biosynthetic protein FliO [Terasakiella pusilla]
MEIADYLRFVFALAFVIAMIGILAFMAKRYGLGYRNGPRSTKRRLSISEIMPIDNKRRLVLVKRDDKEHLIVIGGTTDLVVEQNIIPPEASFSSHLLENAREQDDSKEPTEAAQV